MPAHGIHVGFPPVKIYISKLLPTLNLSLCSHIWFQLTCILIATEKPSRRPYHIASSIINKGKVYKRMAADEEQDFLNVL